MQYLYNYILFESKLNDPFKNSIRKEIQIFSLYPPRKRKSKIWRNLFVPAFDASAWAKGVYEIYPTLFIKNLASLQEVHFSLIEISAFHSEFRVKRIVFGLAGCFHCFKLNSLTNHGSHVSFLRTKVSRNGGRGDGECPVDCRHGRLRPSVGVQQHRGYDFIVRVVQEAYQVDQQAHPGREDRASGCHKVKKINARLLYITYSLDLSSRFNPFQG